MQRAMGEEAWLKSRGGREEDNQHNRRDREREGEVAIPVLMLIGALYFFVRFCS